MRPSNPVESVPLGGIAIERVDGGLWENITLRNIDIAACSVPIFIRHAGGVTFENVTVKVRGTEVRPEVLMDDVTGFVRK